MSPIEVVASPAEGTPIADGFARRKGFETETLRMGETRLSPRAVSAWHHHGLRTVYGYVVTGQLTLEFGPGGVDHVTPTSGSFFVIPPGLIHRDVNSKSLETRIVNVMLGDGPATIDVDGPER